MDISKAVVQESLSIKLEFSIGVDIRFSFKSSYLLFPTGDRIQGNGSGVLLDKTRNLDWS